MQISQLQENKRPFEVLEGSRKGSVAKVCEAFCGHLQPLISIKFKLKCQYCTVLALKCLLEKEKRKRLRASVHDSLLKGATSEKLFLQWLHQANNLSGYFALKVPLPLCNFACRCNKNIDEGSGVLFSFASGRSSFIKIK